MVKMKADVVCRLLAMATASLPSRHCRPSRTCQTTSDLVRCHGSGRDWVKTRRRRTISRPKRWLVLLPHDALPASAVRAALVCHTCVPFRNKGWIWGNIPAWGCLTMCCYSSSCVCIKSHNWSVIGFIVSRVWLRQVRGFWYRWVT